jgi:hypothetical protein
MKKATAAALMLVLFFAVSAIGADAKPVTVKGWLSDSDCAAHGDKKCSNREHIAHGAKLVLVTDGDNKIWTITNPDKLASHQGHYVRVTGTTNPSASTITVDKFSPLKEPATKNDDKKQ